jgi:DNA-binding FrmR family transcriptional regulator
MKEDIKKRSDRRIKIIAGQVAGLTKMIENDKYCMDIMTQNLAIQRSLASLNQLVLDNHIRTHIREMMTSGDEKQIEKATKELISLYGLSNK